MNAVSFRLLGQVGRVGNQLHQIASTVGLAHRHGVPAWFPRWDYERFFNVPDGLFHDGDPPDGAVEAPTLVPHIDERAAVYLQDIRLWHDVAPVVQSMFRPSEWAAERLRRFDEFGALRRPILAVHVRRGDNVPGQDPGVKDKHLWHPLPTLDYYLRAIAAVRDWQNGRQVDGGPFRSVACFSDDPDWCRDHIRADYYHHGVARPKEHEAAYATAPVLDWIDFHLLAACDGFVLSNSTFGAWAAYLNPAAPTAVPWPWYGPNLDYIDARRMLPWDWLTVPREVR